MMGVRVVLSSAHSRTCHEAPDHHFHREHAAALHDGHVGVGDLQQSILHDVLRLAHPPGARQIQDLPLHKTQTLLSPSCMLTLMIDMEWLAVQEPFQAMQEHCVACCWL